MNTKVKFSKAFSKDRLVFLVVFVVFAVVAGVFFVIQRKPFVEAAWPPARSSAAEQHPLRRRASGSESLTTIVLLISTPTKYFVYLLKSLKDKKYYIGQTHDIKKRLNEHNRGEVKSTKSRVPLILVGYEEHGSRDESRWAEYQYKHHSDKKKKFIEKILIKNQVNYLNET